MTQHAESLVERRRLRRLVSRWRFGAVIAVLLLILALVTRADGIAPTAAYVPHIARVSITGIITEDDKLLRIIEHVRESGAVKAVILEIDSPGGTTTGGEALFDAIGRLRAEKPVVAICGTVATSAAYMTAIAADRIFVRGSTITGSVGVIMQWAEVNEALADLGIKVEQVKSGPLKAVPSPFEALNEEGRRVAEEMIADSQKWFLGLVEDRRNINFRDVPGLNEGRVYTGRQAVELKLADAIGAQREAKAWLEKERGVSSDLRVREWKPRDDSGWSLLSMTRALAAFAGFATPLIDSALKSVETARLDGLLSLWHPAAP